MLKVRSFERLGNSLGRDYIYCFFSTFVKRIHCFDLHSFYYPDAILGIHIIRLQTQCYAIWVSIQHFEY